MPDFTMTVKFDPKSGADWGRAAAVVLQGAMARVTTGSKPGMGGGAAESLVKMIPGGGFFTNIGKAFAQGGLFVGMAAGITGFLAIGKGLLNNSKLMQTMTSTFYKTVGAMIDVMLAPLIPLFMKFLGWWIKEGFKYAQQAGQFLAEWLPKIADFLGGIVKALGGLKPILLGIAAALGVWFTAWLIRQGMAAVRGAKAVWGFGSRILGRGAGNKITGIGINKAGKQFYKAGSMRGGKAIGGQLLPAAVAKGGGRSLLGRLGSGLATRTGARAALGAVSRFGTRRGSAMLMGAGTGAVIGAPAFGAGAIPGAIIGAVAGLVISQAAGVAIDAATGQKITLATAVLPGAAEWRDVRKIIAAGDDEALGENAARMKAEAMSIEQMVGRELDENYAKIIGRPNAHVPSTMGTVMGIYSSLEARAREANEKLPEDQDDKGFWSTWSDRIKGVFTGAWGIVQGWWNGIFGDSPGAATADGGSPAEDAVDYDGESFWPGWLSGIGGFFKGAWGTVKGWWNKITGGADDNQPAEKDEEDDTNTFFPAWLTGIGTHFANAWGTVKGWWDKITGGAEDNEPKETNADDDTDTFFPTWLTDIGDLFKKGWGFVKGWWDNLRDKNTDNLPKEASDPTETSLASTLYNIITNPVGSLVDGFKKGAGWVTGWWSGLRDQQDAEEPTEGSDPTGTTLKTTLYNIITNPVGSLIDGFKKGAGWVTGWWSNLRDKQDDEEPKEESDPTGATLKTTLMGFITNPVGSIMAGFKIGSGFVTGWWDKLRGKQAGEEPTEESDPTTATLKTTLMSFITDPVGSIKSGFLKGADFVTGWWEKLRNKQDGEEPKEESDPTTADLKATLKGFITNPVGSIMAGFTKGADFVTGWWKKLRNKQDAEEPKEESDPTTATLKASLISFITDPLGSIQAGFTKGANFVTGWWEKLRDKQDDNEPKEASDPTKASIGTTLTNLIGTGATSIVTGFKTGWTTVKGWWTGLRDKSSANKPLDSDVTSETSIGLTLSMLTGKWAQASGGIKQIFETGWTTVEGWWKGLKTKSAANKPTENKADQTAITTFFDGWGKGIKSAYGVAFQAVKDLWDGIKDRIPKISWNPLTWSFNNVGGYIPGQGVSQGGNVGGYMGMGKQTFHQGWQTGGVIPGPQGALGLAAVHSGELVLPTHLGPNWMNSTKGGTDFKRAMTGTVRGWGTGGESGGGGGDQYMTMNRPTIINISTTENIKEVLEGLSKLEMLEDAAFFSSLA